MDFASFINNVLVDYATYKPILAVFAMWNIAVFFVYGADKYKAIHHMRRISEKTLVLISILFGFVGAVYGMVIFNHKTSKTKFRIFIPLSAIIDIFIILLLLKLWLLI